MRHVHTVFETPAYGLSLSLLSFLLFFSLPLLTGKMGRYLPRWRLQYTLVWFALDLAGDAFVPFFRKEAWLRPYPVARNTCYVPPVYTTVQYLS